jgi:hypothetical protein
MHMRFEPPAAQHALTSDEAIEAGQRWVGEGYREVGDMGSGVFHGADGSRQSRMGNGFFGMSHGQDYGMRDVRGGGAWEGGGGAGL